MQKLNEFLRSKQGEIGLFVFVLIIFILCLTTILVEYLRVYSLRDSLEYQLQRGINVALEDAIMDSWRSDGLKDANISTKNQFYAYLINEMSLTPLDSKYQLGTGSGVKYWLTLDSLIYTGETANYVLNLEATAEIKTIFGKLLGKNIMVPINVKSKNNLIGTMPKPDFIVESGDDYD